MSNESRWTNKSSPGTFSVSPRSEKAEDFRVTSLQKYGPKNRFFVAESGLFCKSIAQQKWTRSVGILFGAKMYATQNCFYSEAVPFISETPPTPSRTPTRNHGDRGNSRGTPPPPLPKRYGIKSMWLIPGPCATFALARATARSARST